MNDFYHSGVLGMKWGVRRYQNEDGSYKPGAEGRYYTPKQQKYNAKQLKKALKSKDLHYIDNKFSREVKKQIDQIITKDEIKQIGDLWNEAYRSDKYKYYKDPNYADLQMDEESLDLFYDNFEKYKKACENVTNKLIGEYGDIKIKAYKAKTSQSLKDRVNFEITHGNISKIFMYQK